MAECSIKDIASRIKNIESTNQIIKAMELISSSKLQKYGNKLEKVRLFSKSLNESFESILKGKNLEKITSDKNNDPENSCYVIIGSDKGMAGSYNSNVLKLFEENSVSEKDIVLPIGKKIIDYFSKKKFEILSNEFSSCEKMTFESCKKISNLILNEYHKNRFGKIFLIYTEFVSPLKQVESIKRIFPLASKNTQRNRKYYLCEPSYEECFKKIIPYYVSGNIWVGVCESLAGEQGSRQAAMESAGKNACEMVDNLRLTYNQLRQSAITQEITEIIAGT